MPRVRAIEPFIGESSEELSFQRGDVFLVLDSENQAEGWLKGLKDGLYFLFLAYFRMYLEWERELICFLLFLDNVGVFPKIFVEYLPDKVVSQVNNPGFATESYQALSEEELSFRKGEMVFVESNMEYGWSKGYITEPHMRKGIFPTSLVQVIEDKPTPPDPASQNLATSTSRNTRPPVTLQDYASSLRTNVVGNNNEYSDNRPSLQPYTSPTGSFQQQYTSPTGSFQQPYNQPTVPQPIETPSLDNLPPGWEKCYLPDGTPFFIDHINRTTSWSLPAPQPSIRPVYQYNLKPGWEQMVDLNGNTFFVDHNTRSTHWNYPYPL